MLDENEAAKAFAYNLIRLMKRDSITQKELAERVGAGVGTVNNWVHGVNVPRTGMVNKLTRIFNCNPSDLLADPASAPAHKFEREVLAEGGMRLLLDADTKLTDEQLREIVNFIRYQQQKNDRT